MVEASSESGKVLNRYKCTYCREKKVKCDPPDRAWPARCERCVKKDLPCTEPQTSTGKTFHNIESSDAAKVHLGDVSFIENGHHDRTRWDAFPDAVQQVLAREEWFLPNRKRRKVLQPARVAKARLGKPRLYHIALMVIHRIRSRNALKLSTNVCEACSAIGLTPDAFLINSKPLDETRAPGQAPSVRDSQRRLGQHSPPFIIQRLGSLSTVRQKSLACAFCRLVLQSVQDQEIDGLLSLGVGFLGSMAALRVEDEGAPSSSNKLLKSECTADWILDGREIIRDLTSSSISQVDRTRRIRLTWDSPEIRDSYITLMVPKLQEDQENSLFLGRQIGWAQSNLSLIQGWMDICDQCHGSKCRIEKTASFRKMAESSFFGVVDVQDWRLTSLPVGEKYATISRVWGREVQFFATTENIGKLQTKDGIKSILRQLSKPVADSLLLIRNLGIRYAWVDSLCIVQDPDDSREAWKLAPSMDLIFSHSHVTICATDGENGQAGLLALDSSLRRVRQYSEDYSPHVRLMTINLAETYIQKSTWNSRAWVFQERLLSRRCLIFADSRVFFQCRSSVMREDVITEHRDAGWSVENTVLPLVWEKLDNQAHSVYAQTVLDYTSRVLSYSKDRLPAFQGIANVIGEAMGGKLIWGLPSTCFDWALLWQSVEAPPHQNSPEFPSWSWCGWDGQPASYNHVNIASSFSLQEWLKSHTWVVWYIRNADGDLRLVWNSWTTTNDDQALKKRKSRYSYILEIRDFQVNDYDPFGRPRHKQVPSFATTFSRTLPSFPYGVRIAHQTSSKSDLQYLQFFTWSASFELHPSTPLPRKPPRKNRRFGIHDRNMNWCGTIIIDQAWYYKHQQEHQRRGEITSEPTAISTRAESVRSTQIERPTHEFLAISEAQSFSEEECLSWNYYIPRERLESESDPEWDLYYVLLIETNAVGISSRVGLGKMFQKAFESPCVGEKEWKEIILG